MNTFIQDMSIAQLVNLLVSDNNIPMSDCNRNGLIVDAITAHAERHAAAEAELQALREQEPVAWRWCWNTYRRHGEDGWGYSEGQPPDRENATVEPLYPAAPQPPAPTVDVEAVREAASDAIKVLAEWQDMHREYVRVGDLARWSYAPGVEEIAERLKRAIGDET